MPTGGLNLFGLHQFDNKDSFFSGQAILSQSVGYGVVIGYGTFFVLLTLAITFLDQKFGGTKNTSEEFNTAGRGIKTGLVAVDVVSRWTWVATLLVSANEAYLYGISGAFWYGSGAVIQLFLFGVLALELKRKAPMAHTVIELVHLRWGKFASFVYLYLCYLNNFCVCAILFIGAGNVLTAITGMNIYSSLVLLPFGVVIYTFSGGLKATFTSSYVHTVIIYVTLNILIYKVYASNREPIGSIGKVWNNLKVVASVAPVKGNMEGSYLTMFSKGGFQFAIWNAFGTFGGIFADQAYWQGAIAASPKGAFRGYILGGLLWFPIPFALATALGLAALALDLPISTEEFNEGLVTVATAQYLMGKGGVILMLTIVFMSATSAGSAEFMSMSSLWTYDVYKRYINPKATSKQLLFVSQTSVVFFGMLMGGVSCFCKAVSIDVNFLFFVGALLVSSAFPPLCLMVAWRKVPAGAAIASALGGQALSLAAWLGHTQIVYGRMTVSDTLQRLGPTLDGTIVAVMSSAIICVVWTLVAPEEGDTFARWQLIETMDDEKAPLTPEDGLEQHHTGWQLIETMDDEKAHHAPKDGLELQHPLFNNYSLVAFIAILLIFIVWPLLTLPAKVFSKGYFTFWVILSMIWATVASAVATFLPLIEARDYLMMIVKNVLGFKVTQPGSVVNALPVTSAVNSSQSTELT